MHVHIFRWAKDFFGIVCCFLLFNVGDLVTNQSIYILLLLCLGLIFWSDLGSVVTIHQSYNTELAGKTPSDSQNQSMFQYHNIHEPQEIVHI